MVSIKTKWYKNTKATFRSHTAVTISFNILFLAHRHVTRPFLCAACYRLDMMPSCTCEWVRIRSLKLSAYRYIS